MRSSDLERIPVDVQMRPMRYAQIYLWSTFLLFLIGSLSADAPSIHLLIMFVVFAYGLFYVGYRLGVLTKKRKIFHDQKAASTRIVVLVVALGAIYYTVFSLTMLADFGVTSFGALADAILNPGASYKAKLEVFEQRVIVGGVNRITQILVLASILYAAMIPVLVCYWERVSRHLRAFALFSVGLYAIAFLAIGTMKGIGDIILFVAAGVAVRISTRSVVLSKVARRSIQLAVFILAVSAAVYMGAGQVSRAQEFQLVESRVVGDISQSVVARTFGYDVAFGFYSTLAYPSHGYLGLAYNLDQDFVFSRGAGLSPAFESYRYQYLGGESNAVLTYPARTEFRTGWPAGMYWSTIFPWIASDLTFFGAGLFMGLVGFVFARVWLRCVAVRDPVALTVLGQIFVFVAFIPANNQVLMQRQGFWILVALLLFVLLKLMARVRV
ncbi:MAG: hypothetical protein U1D69_09935 [Polynucleobacter sp.]|nr:hypothetical protein [Polynucleobacter sp.]